jgi:HTH-type transcriptional regulator, sugar sensing transcriptional regulator
VTWYDQAVDERTIVAQLIELGLTTYEAKAYLALTRRDSSTAAQTARLSDVPRQRIYDVLATLVEKGLASTRPGDVVKYVATPPEQALEGLLAPRRQQLAAQEQAASTMVEQLGPAYLAGQAQSDPLEYIEVLRDRRAINERFEELQRGIKNEILVFTKPPYATPAQENVEGLEVVSSHVARSIYEYSAFDDPAFAEGVRRFIKAGEDARFVPLLPLKLVIIDESIVMFGLEDPVAGSAGLTMMVVDHSALAKTLKISFDAIWESGLTFDQAAQLTSSLRAKSA